MAINRMHGDDILGGIRICDSMEQNRKQLTLMTIFYTSIAKSSW
jgi:hypothetical protein